MKKPSQCDTCATCKWAVLDESKMSTGVYHGRCTYNPVTLIPGSKSRKGIYPDVQSTTPACRVYEKEEKETVDLKAPAEVELELIE